MVDAGVAHAEALDETPASPPPDERVRTLLRSAAASAGPGRPATGSPELLALLEEYWAHVPLAELTDRAVDDLVGAARSHADLADGRSPGEVVVRALNPARGTHGWHSVSTVVEVVTEDMPYLVDSVGAELARQGLAVRAVVHPVMQAGDRPTSWIHVEVDRVPDDRLPAVTDGVRSAIAAVQAAVGDAPAVAALLRGAADAMPDDEDGQEAARYLRWMADGSFVALGARVVPAGGGAGADGRDETREQRLGLLRPGVPGLTGPSDDAGAAAGEAPAVDALPAELAAPLADDERLRLAQGDVRAPIVRRAYVDHVMAALHDAEGHRTGEVRVVGLYDASAATQSVTAIPVLERKAAEVLRLAGFPPDSHSGRDLMAILETFPREELRLATVEHVARVAVGVLELQSRRRPRVFLREDPWGRYVSCLVYLPRERYTTAVRLRIADLLQRAFGAAAVGFEVWIASSLLSRVHFVVRAPEGQGGLRRVDEAQLSEELARVVRTWEEDLAVALAAEVGQEAATERLRRWGAAFPEAYKEDFGPREAVADLARVAAVEAGEVDTALHLRTPAGAEPDEHRLTLVRRSPLLLTSVMPVLANLGVEVVDERPYVLTPRPPGTSGAAGASSTAGAGQALEHAYVYDFGLRYATGPGVADAGTLLQEAFWQAWRGRTESDGLDRLVLAAGLRWDQVAVLRAYVKYLRQAGLPFSQAYVERTLLASSDLVRLLLELFEARFDPDLEEGMPSPAASGGPEEATAAGLPDDVSPARAAAVAALAARADEALADVEGLDADRTLRALASLVSATVRTNAYQRGPDGSPKPYLAFKLDPSRISELPEPRPVHEVWVYSPQVEGVHLRFGDVARGGLRWSDRREDFRTEVLGLVRAQVVKNAVIVPTGAKGGFVAKRLLASSTTGAPVPPVDRETQAREGRECYTTFVHGLLDVTDDLAPAVDGARPVRPPGRVVRHDGDDPYLVVAADKGTATFSDLANAVAAEHGFWLGDAFASGGSVGYDHKAMGITARGAWVSVQRHFRERGHDVQTQPFTVVGIGDMSGDVFGNGMLLSEQIRLVAAFDHRHVFLDPDPDPAASVAERRRLFELPRSSWDDYDRSLISEGGGVYPRTAKSVPISAEVAEALGLRPGTTSLTPPELIKAVLCAPVDLLWNGGIGTYVKASTESHAAAGDKANDAIRVNGADLRVAVVGEGGNLGLTQRGRVEAALHGVALNTDAVDNSAGVDCSDHEVNIKILLDQVVATGDLTREERNALLGAMTDEVGRLVLSDNDEQNAILGDVRALAPSLLRLHQRFAAALEGRGALDRRLEAIPDDAGFTARAEDGVGLTTPETSVLLALAKTTLGADLLATSVPEEDWAQRLLQDYFPRALVERFGDRLASHPLRRQIVTTCLVNDLVNRGGITFAFRAGEETGADPDAVARAYAVARDVFDAPGTYARVRELDGVVATSVQTVMTQELRRLLDRAVRWFLHNGSAPLDVAASVERFAPAVQRWRGRMDELLRGSERSRLRRQVERLEREGVPHDLARRAAGLLDEFALLDIARCAGDLGVDLDVVAEVHFALSERYGVDDLLGQIAALPRDDRWQVLARGALREDLYAVLDALVRAALADAASPAGPGAGGAGDEAPGEEPTARERADAAIAAWEAAHQGPLTRARRVLDEVRRLEGGDLAPLSVALRLLRGAVRTTAA